MRFNTHVVMLDLRAGHDGMLNDVLRQGNPLGKLLAKSPSKRGFVFNPSQNGAVP